uniref:Uncharacterized protein n=1 Tax=Ochrobactrum phage ORM_20 TaxID=2985243 RepID=A0A9N6WS41_9VIRU|nr:hypothetical protein ORM20_00120 [Ochrobactrum phage ORM_20]
MAYKARVISMNEGFFCGSLEVKGEFSHDDGNNWWPADYTLNINSPRPPDEMSIAFYDASLEWLDDPSNVPTPLEKNKNLVFTSIRETSRGYFEVHCTLDKMMSKNTGDPGVWNTVTRSFNMWQPGNYSTFPCDDNGTTLFIFEAFEQAIINGDYEEYVFPRPGNYEIFAHVENIISDNLCTINGKHFTEESVKNFYTLAMSKKDETALLNSTTWIDGVTETKAYVMDEVTFEGEFVPVTLAQIIEVCEHYTLVAAKLYEIAANFAAMTDIPEDWNSAENTYWDI